MGKDRFRLKRKVGLIIAGGMLVLVQLACRLPEISNPLADFGQNINNLFKNIAGRF